MSCLVKLESSVSMSMNENESVMSIVSVGFIITYSSAIIFLNSVYFLVDNSFLRQL